MFLEMRLYGTNQKRKRLLIAQRIQVKKTKSRRGTSWQSTRNFILNYKTPKDVTITAIKITAPLEIRNIAPREMSMSGTQFPMYVNPDQLFTVDIKRGQKVISVLFD